MPQHHHNPLDPRDPLAPVFYFTFLTQDNERPARRGRGGDMPGCGCLLLAIALLWMILAK